MKRLHETFTDEEFEKLLIAKEKAGMNWHEFIMTLADENGEQGI